ncbi:Serine/threonine-protein kinase oca2 [Diplogelasinospora grovesii]|uniref:non-specific serine/threonine protein kinase n=1 Tax=Diplogelasinospora grovesii TaxID=303347 RepID=A0AAN6S912_9PEZI|nr:Serine/threonine-protein kinase oca2 [Diplogelasinospora grovesii]
MEPSMATVAQASEQKPQDSQQHQGLNNDASDTANGQKRQPTPAVRFKSAVEEISPRATATNSSATVKDGSLGEPGAVTPEQIRALSKSLRACPIQERRMNIFSYEPFSLPASRTASHEDDSRTPSREVTRSSAGHNSPLLGPGLRTPEMHTPPLTPAGTGPAEGEQLHRERGGAQDKLGRTPDIITPQDSTHEVPSPARSRPGSRDPLPRRPLSSEDKEHLSIGDHRKGLFSIGAGSQSPSSSVPASREASPSRAAASQFYTRQLPPAGDAHDPYAANRREAQKGIDSRFIFPRKKNHSSASLSAASTPKVSTEKRPSGLFAGHGHRKDEVQRDEGLVHSRNSSFADLKRFLKLTPHNKVRRTASPAASTRSGTKTPPGSSKGAQIPFGDDHGLTSKYGKLGKVLGAGAGGSVRLMKRSEDSVVFAVKEFRPRHSYETEREYVKKLTAEYCMGSSLHHGNIIETLDIVSEKGKWYEVMEYAPYDLFAIVMTGKMSREEVTCCFLQILSGVTYLHSMGLAHRDLKLDNVVVSERGIMKIIDFGSAHVFKYPFENGIVLASGIVGSDPYLAPEVYNEKKYDPQAVDIWSLAIIYCCMTLRRFPWKIPRMTDNSFKLFAAEPSPGHDPRKLILPSAVSATALSDIPARAFDTQSVKDHPAPKSDNGKSDHADEKSEQTDPRLSGTTIATQGEAPPAEKKEVIRGPWRILRLLPRESRHVIGRMLEIDPKKRAKMSEVLDDVWVANAVICRQLEGGVVINADDHTHILEPPSTPAPKN